MTAYRPSKWRIVFVAVLFAATLTAGYVSPAGGAYTETVPRPFNSDEWKSADTWNDTRCGMLVDLRTRIGVKGKTRKELIGLLGPVDDENVNPSTSHWHLCPSFMDFWILEVSWEGDVAKEAWVRDA